MRYSYDTAGRLLALTNENGASYHFKYDPLDRLIEEQGLDGILSKYEYDEAGNVVKKIEVSESGEQYITHFKRDKASNLIEKLVEGRQEKQRTYYHYDEGNQLTKAINNTATVSLSYDKLGRLLQEESRVHKGRYRASLTHSYDALGNRVETILPNGKKVNWVYQAGTRLSQIEIDGKVLTRYQRDALEREIARTQGALTSIQEYDSIGRLIKQSVRKNTQNHHTAHLPSPKAQMQRIYSYDASGELLSIEDSRKGKFVYGYDAIGRVTHAKTPSTQELFSFDPAHNLVEDGKSLLNNRIETYQDKRYTYDDFGNMQTKKISSHTQMAFAYNLEHQMTKAAIIKNNLTQEYSYGYDPFGRRVSKTDAFGTTYFTWDGNRLLSETRGTKEQTYIYEQEGFVPVAIIDEDQNISYYHTDHLGTPQELTNTEGEIVWEAEYTTWGNTAKVSYKQADATITEAVAIQPLRFQGQYYDKETGLHYNRFRYYDPDVGRFTTQDPIGLAGGTNIYQYAPNPVVWIDPWGLAATEAVGKTPRGKGCIPKELRDKVRIFTDKQKNEALDLQDHKCPNCGLGITKSTSAGHHIKRHADGGPTTQCNLAMLCNDCHKYVHKK